MFNRLNFVIMKRKFGNLLMAATLLLAMGVSFTSCRDYDEELVAEQNAQAQSLQELNEQLTADKAELQAAINAILPTVGTEIEGLNAEIAALKERIAALEAINHDHSNFATKEELAAAKAELEKAIAELAELTATKAELQTVEASLDALKGEFATHVGLYNTLSATVADAVGRLSTLEGKFGTLDVAVGQAQKDIKTIQNKLAEVAAQAAAADALAKANSTKIAVLEAYGEEVAQALKDSVAAVRTVAAANLIEAKEYAKAVADAVAEDLAATNATVSELQEALRIAVAELQDQIDVLAEKVDDLAERVKKYFESQITNIVLNGAYSPVVGYFAWPTGVKSNILAAYYGEIADGYGYVDFPTADYTDMGVEFDYNNFYALGFDSKAMKIKNNADGVLLADGANAGKVYMTINPAEVNLAGKSFSLVNSLGEEAPAILSTPVPSDMKLNFGYTRAGAVSLYEAEARIEDVESAKIRMDLSEIKDVIKDVLSIKDGVSVSNVVTSLYSLVNDIADAHAVKAEWVDADGVGHTVYSDFGLATVAVKPLGYNSLADLNIQTVPGYHKVMNVVNSVIDEISAVSIPDLGFADLVLPEIKSIDLEGLKEGNIEFRVKIAKTVDYHLYKEIEVPVEDAISVWTKEESYDVKDVNGNVIGKVVVPAQEISLSGKDIVNGKVVIDEWLSIPVEVDQLVSIPKQDVLGDLSNSLDNINDMITGLESFLSQVNGMLAEVNGTIESVEGLVGDVTDKVQNGLNKYLDKLNNKLCSMINSFNAVLQPTMLVATENGDGFSMLSSIKGAPTTIDGNSAVLVPTSFSAEILAPALHKFVAVTNVLDADGKQIDDWKTVAEAANTGDFATVLSGDTRAVEFNAKSGYTYEITYSACDFYGMIANTKYYVRVK